MKKSLLILIACLLANFAIGQDTIYLNLKYKEMDSSIGASYYKTIEKLESTHVIERVYLLSGQIRTETGLKIVDTDKKIYEGSHKIWYKTGELHFSSLYEKGKKHGAFLSFWKNGVQKRQDIYKRGKLKKKGVCKNEKGEKVPYYDFETFPSFPGGQKEMYAFIKRQIKYPSLSKANNIGGKVIVDFKIDTTGKVIEVKIKQSVNAEIDREALRIINSMPHWSPGFQDGTAVSVKYRIPIMFNPN